MKKRLLSIALTLCMAMTLIPTVTLAASQTLTANDAAGLRNAISNAAAGDTIAIGSDFSIASSIIINKNVTLDLAGHTLTYTSANGGICLRFTAGGMITDSVGGGILTGSVANSLLVHNYGGTLEVAGGRIFASGSQSRAIQNDGTLHIIGGEVNATSGYAILNNGTVVVSGGQVVTDTGVGVLNITAASALTISGGIVKTTSTTAEQTYAAYNNIAGATILVNGGTVSAENGSAIGNFNGGTATVSGGTVSATSGKGISNFEDSSAIIDSGTVSSVSGYGVLNYGHLAINGGTVSSETSVAFSNFAKGGMDIRLSDGRITSARDSAIFNNGSGEIQLLGSTVSTTAEGRPAVVNASTGTVTVKKGEITAASRIPTLYNVSSGTIVVYGGTYFGAYNASAFGAVKIDGGSIKEFQGLRPKNSAGVELHQYIIKLTNNGAPIAGTFVSDSELTFSPVGKAAGYGFTGVKTDADGRLYLWLPAGITNALYKNQAVDITGAVSGGEESILPNFNVSVTVYLNDTIWTDCPSLYHPVLAGSTGIIEASSFKAGVFTYNGLDKDAVCDVLGLASLGRGSSGVTVSKNNSSVEVHYYTVATKDGGGISSINVRSGSHYIQGTNVTIAAFPQSGLTFEKWTDEAGTIISTNFEFKTGKLDGPRTYTAFAKVTPFDAGVTVRKNGTAWTDFGGEVVLSPSPDNANTIISGTPAVTPANGVYNFSGLTQTYYVWAKLPGGQLVYTGQKVTFGATAATVDYYTVVLNKGSNINQVTGAGIYLKGSSVQVSAGVVPESGGLTYVFSRWTEGGALLSANNPYVISSISRSYDLTAEGRTGSFSATVTLNKDHALWTSGIRAIHLSEQGSDVPITGVASNGVYTFSGLDTSKKYDIWDDGTVQKTGVSLDASDRNKTLNYFTVTVSKGSGVTSVSGNGVYLAGSTVAATAAPEPYYTVTWQATGTAGNPNGATYTVSNLDAPTTLTAAGSLVNFTGTVALKKDDTPWSGQTVRLSTDSAITGTIVPVSSTNGNDTFTGLDPHNTYYIYVNGKETGKTLTNIAVNATLDYYTIEVSLDKVTFDAKVGTAADSGPYLKGITVTLTATLTDPNNDFVGWYSGSTLLSSEKKLTVSGIAAKQTLSAVASSTFDAAVTINGKADVSGIKLSQSSSALTNAVSGTAVGNKVSFGNLTRGAAYYIFDGNTYTGKSVSKIVPEATLQYYTITVNTSTGISTATVNNNTTAAVLEGTAVTLNAAAEANYVLSKWVDGGGSTVAQANPATVTVGKDMTLTAVSIGNYTGGEIDIATGWIEIADGTGAGTLKIMNNGTLLGDNINPSQNITIKGNGTPTGNRILISATLAGAASGSAIRLTLKDVKISVPNNAALEISNNAGDVELAISGTNSLETMQSLSGVIKKTGANKLAIRSIDGTTNHTLTALANGDSSSGIGCWNNTVSNITIESGLIIVAGSGSGIGTYGRYSLTDGIMINGGLVRSTEKTENPGAYNNCVIGSNNLSLGGLSKVTVNGGTARLKLNGIISNPNGVKFNGGNLLLDSGNYATPQNDKGENVYKTTFTVPGDTTGGLDVSKTLIIKDKNNTVYGMNDVKTFEGGKVYAYLPAGTAIAIYDGKTYQTNVKSDGTAEFTQVYKVNTPASKTVNGVTATASAPVLTGAGYSVTITLSGTAIKPGVIGLGLSGSVGTVAAQTQSVTQGAVISVTKTFVFPMPAADVTDLALAMTFTETSSNTVTYTAPNATAGAAPVDANRYYEGNTYTVAAAGTLERTGYHFAGWKTGADTHAANSTQTMGTTGVIYTALWNANTYKVIFNGNGSTSGTMADQTFVYDASANALSSNAFTRTGYTFAGWASSATGSKAYSQGEAVRNLTAIENDTVNLYALWTPSTYTVTFEGNGATSGTMENQTVAHNTPTTLNANGFTRAGYTFAGWKAADGTPYANGASTTASGNITLTAQWTANPYSVAFNGNGSTSGTMNGIDLVYGTAGNLPANGFSRTGYTFAGWNTAADGKGTSYADQAQAAAMTTVYNDTVQLYAQWTANTYSVKFNLNNGDSGTMEQQSFTYDTPETALSANKFLRSGYTFTGWNSVADGSGAAYADKAQVKNLTADSSGVIQLYAQWSPGSFTVNFAAGSGNGVMTAQDFYTGDTAALKTNTFSRMGYTFAGWNTEAGGGGTAYGAQATVNTLNLGASDSITLYAQWSPNLYTVKFNANGATGTMAHQTFTYDTPAAALTQNAFTRDGYTFLGWAGNPASTYGEYADQQQVQNLTPLPEGIVTLYAAWKANSVAVAFNGNGATTGSMENQIFTYNMKQLLSQNTYQREGYTFAGWNTQSNGRGVSYINEQEITNPTPDVTGSMTLYAQWQQQSRYGLSGIVTTDETPAAPIANATVTLKQGNNVLGVTKTDENGRYSFANLLPGSYNVVCTDDGKTVTKVATVVESPVIVPFILSSTAKNSLLELGNEANVTIPALVVDRLNTVADEQATPGKVTTVKLTVTAKTPNEKGSEQTAIRELTNLQTVDMYLDAQLTCNGSSIGKSNNTVLEILIPYNFSSKTDIQVLRYHDGTATALTKLNSRPTSDFKDGTWFDDVSAGRIFVYASKFSTYAISYSPVSSGGGSGGGSGGLSGYPIIIDNIEHGRLTAGQTSAPAGTEITIAAKPGDGYRLHHLIVTDTNGKAIIYTDKGNGTYTFVMPNGKATVSAEFSPEISKADFPFVDVPKNHWAYADIAWAYENGIFNGTGDGTTFSPGLSTTRGMIATLLWRIEGKPAASGDCPFDDVGSTSYYEQAILWAAGNKIVEGYGNGLFGPDDTITREQMAAILYRYVSYKGYDVSKKVALDTFADGSKTSGYAVEAIGWAVANGLLSGKGNSILDPKAGATRAEVAAILARFDQVFGKN